jgi:hypothetical protein
MGRRDHYRPLARGGRPVNNFFESRDKRGIMRAWGKSAKEGVRRWKSHVRDLPLRLYQCLFYLNSTSNISKSTSYLDTLL